MPKEMDWENLRLCLDNYDVEGLYIRDCGGVREDGKFSCQGRWKLTENLEGKKLDFRKDDSGLYFLIDSKEVFHFSLEDEYQKGFSLAYDRIRPTEEGVGRRVVLQTGIDPYDPALPEPTISTLRNIFDYHQTEITFKGRVHLKFNSWWKEPHWKYWQIALKGQEPDWDFIDRAMENGYGHYRFSGYD